MQKAGDLREKYSVSVNFISNEVSSIIIVDYSPSKNWQWLGLYKQYKPQGFYRIETGGLFDHGGIPWGTQTISNLLFRVPSVVFGNYVVLRTGLFLILSTAYGPPAPACVILEHKLKVNPEHQQV